MYQNGGALPAEVMATLALMPDVTAVDHASALLPGLEVDMMQMNMDLVDLDPDVPSQPGVYNNPFPSQQQQLQAAAASAFGPGSADDAVQMGSTATLTGAGAGPLPAGFGAQSSNPTGSTLTEFTKRRNWTQRVLEELRDLLHILTPDGRVLYVSPSCKYLTGYEPHELVGRIITDYIHPDDKPIFIKEFNESIATGHPLRFFYRFKKNDPNGAWAIFESHGHPHVTTDPGTYSPSTLSCRGFFMMARPYPTKNTALLDSFLEHKIENERLMKRIAELKREEQEDETAEDAQWTESKDGKSTTASGTVPPDGRTESDNSSLPYNGMPPPAKPVLSNTALTRQNLNEALAASKPDSINDKMARYEGATHLETIEMLTGLRYRDGERSQGISTGDASPLLIRGDAGIQIPLDRDGRTSSDKKKKLKLADEYVCTDCGTLDSPEWRKGPNGPKTLCNACGLRWAKKEKKRQQQQGSTQPTSSSTAQLTGSGNS